MTDEEFTRAIKSVEIVRDQAQAALVAQRQENERLLNELGRRRSAFDRCRDRLAVELDRGDRLADALALAGQALAVMATGQTVLDAVSTRRSRRWNVSEDGDVSEQVPF